METYQKKCKHGTFVLLAADYISDCMSTYGEWAEREVQLFDAILREGDVVFEIGANIGTHAVPIAKKISPTGKLFCIEAQRLLFQILGANLVLNNLTNVRTVCAIATNQNGHTYIKEEDFSIPGNRGGYSVLSNTADASGELTVVTSLDKFVEIHSLPRLDLLKIDVERMEEMVLRGAEQCIQTFQPYLFFECGKWDSPELHAKDDLMHAWLKSLGYRLFWYNCLGFNPNNFAGNPENVMGTFGDINVLAVPHSRTVPRSLVEVSSVAEVYNGIYNWVE